MMDKYFKVSIWSFSFKKATFIFLSKKKKRCDFITKHLTDFAMLYVVSLVLIIRVFHDPLVSLNFEGFDPQIFLNDPQNSLFYLH